MPTRCLVFCLSLALCLCLSGVPAAAQDAPPHEGEGVRQSRPKAQAPVQKGQAAAAQKASGGKAPVVSADRKKPAPAKAAKGPAVKNDGKPYLRSLDKNHDGRVSREEFVAGSKKRFAKADSNRDGVVSPQEGKAAKAMLQEKQAKADARRAAQGKPARQNAKGGKASKPHLATFDKNRDGRVTEKEYLARREKKFVEMDLNRDGVISREEARIAKQKLLERRAEKKAQAKERRLRKIEEARLTARQAPGTVSSSGPELMAPASPPPPPAVSPPASPPTQSIPGHPEAPLTPLTPDLPAQGAPAT